MVDGGRPSAAVIGAGIGGLTCAIALRKAGVDVSVHEKQSELREVGSGLTLWVNAMRVLQHLGVADAIEAQGASVDRIENHTSSGAKMSQLNVGAISAKYRAPNVCIHRGELQQALAAQLDDGIVHLGSEFTGFEQDADGVTVRFADGSEQRVDLLVGADGIRSLIRAALGGTQPPRYSGYTCWRSATQLDHADLDRRVYIQLYGTKSNFGIFPIRDGWSWYGTRFAAPGGGDRAAWKREATEAFREWSAPVRAVIDATPEEAFARADIYDHVPIETWVSGRVALLGDAAHATTPTLGQGGCLSIEDGAVLGRAIEQESTVAAALLRYQSERLARANGIVRQAWLHGKIYHGVNPAMRVARQVMLRGPERIAMREVDKLMGYYAL